MDPRHRQGRSIKGQGTVISTFTLHHLEQNPTFLKFSLLSLFKALKPLVFDLTLKKKEARLKQFT